MFEYVRLKTIAANGKALAMAGYSMPDTTERQPNKELNVQNMNKSPP